MEKVRKYSGEFADKKLELEYFNEEMRSNVNFVGAISIIFGLLYMLFFISDYFVIKSENSLKIIFLSRLVFLVLSIVFYIAIKKVRNFSNVAYFITAYEFVAVNIFLVILFQYNSLSSLSFYSVIVMTLVIYFIPNKLVFSQIISIFLSLCFFIFYVNRIEELDILFLIKIISYNLFIIIYCNISSYFTNYYKRKQFVNKLKLIRASTTDSLTGIYNRAKFDEELKQWIEYSNRYKDSISLVIFDIDNFKKINDIYGHPVGDNVLKGITLLIKDTIRITDIFARWGGDEFVILLTNTDFSQSVEIVERIRVSIQNYEFDISERVTCSFGITELKDTDNAESFIKRADKLLYEAKDQGKNVCIINAKAVL